MQWKRKLQIYKMTPDVLSRKVFFLDILLTKIQKENVVAEVPLKN